MSYNHSDILGLKNSAHFNTKTLQNMHHSFPLLAHAIRSLLLTNLLLFGSLHVQAQEKPLQRCLNEATTPLQTLECFRGITYRVDGALDDDLRWTRWANTDQTFDSAGLNCSGLTHAATRALLELQVKNLVGEETLEQTQRPALSPLSLDQAKIDRLADSGANAPMGEDWDFGIDLILNLTEGMPRKLIPNPFEYSDIDSQQWSALDLRGTNIDSPDMAEVLKSLKPEHIYYFAISKSDSRFAGGVSFYHVGLLIKDGNNIWMYHATAKGGVYRVNLAGESGLAWLVRYYGGSPTKGARYIQLIEVPWSST